jgi:hypothetical protein
VPIKNINPRNISAINSDGVLENSVVIGSFNINGKDSLQIAETNFLKGAEDEKLVPENEINKRLAILGRALDGVFDLKNMNMMGPSEYAVAYLSFWVYSPRSLVNLLTEPDMPRLDILVGADDGYQVFLNQKQLASSFKPEGLKKREHTISAVPLENGWNHFLIKAINYGGDWRIAVEFSCSNNKFMHELKSQVAQ